MSHKVGMVSPCFFRWGGLALALMVPMYSSGAEPVTVDVRVDQPGARINPAMWGIFFEDINFGADGGLYAELVKNRSFEFPDPLMGWTNVLSNGAQGTVSILNESPFHPANSNYVRVTSGSASGFGIANEGFRGMGIEDSELYDFTAWIRRVEGSPKSLRVELVGADQKPLASARVKGLSSGWRKQKAVLRSNATAAKAHLRVFIEGQGTVDLDMVSLFPRRTWKGRPGGLRADMVQVLADLKPGFLRFPGGCIVEGRYLTNRYQWKTTIGTAETRKLIINRWNDEFKHRPAPDYYQSFGLGFFEFFQLCEDIGAEPMPILNCGMACQFNSGELAPDNQLEPYIQDALDLIEFANGPISSPWGSRRAAFGHAKPFGLKLLGVGNEQWGPDYFARYEKFAHVLKERHPEVQLIASAGPAPGDDRFKKAWDRFRELRADIIDEHCYDNPEWFLRAFSRYDAYDRVGPKVFMGEYAAQSVRVASPENRNTLECALAEAVFMAGMERNADVVRMASYAPLFGHIDGWQWTPDLIWCDNLNVYGTPSYYVQQLFCLNRGDVVLPTRILRSEGPAARPVNRLYASGTRDEKSGEVILKMVNPSGDTVTAQVRLSGASDSLHAAKATVLAGSNPADENSFAEPKKVAPVYVPLGKVGREFNYQLKPYSMTVLKVEAKR